MSISTLFDSGGSYEINPTTYSTGDKTFGELDKGDYLYVLEKYCHTFTKIEVKGKFKKHKGRLLLPISGLDKKRHIDFGSICSGNVLDAKSASIIDYSFYELIGTNKKTLLKFLLDRANIKYEDINRELENIKYKIDKLTTMLENEE
jgi:hypothetical protein